MRILVLADVGQRVYHVGDEAIGMSAAAALRARGLDVTLLSRDVEASASAAADLGVDLAAAFPLPFRPALSHQAFQWALEKAIGFLDGLRPSEDEHELALHDLVSRVAAADAVLIAGGGSFNSEYGWLLRERLLLGRIALEAGKQLAITGQSLGPTLTQADAQLAEPVFAGASLVGLRDKGSLELFAQRFPHLSAHACLDDASFFSAPAAFDPVETPDRYVLVSLGGDHGQMDDDEAVAGYARTIDAVCQRSGLPAMLVPHMSVPRSGQGDEDIHHRVAQCLVSEHILLDTEDAAAAAARSRHAAFVVASRFHPVVFALSQGKPVLPLVPGAYSTQRVGGLLDNWGLGDQMLTDSQLLASDAPMRALTVWDRRHELTGYLREAAGPLRRFHNDWWDALVRALSGQEALPPRLSEVALPSAPNILPARLPKPGEATTEHFERILASDQATLVAEDDASATRISPFTREPHEEYVRAARAAAPERISGNPLATSGPQVSVIVRTKDREMFLRRALRDITAQRYRDVQVIVVNDGGQPEPVDSAVALLCPGAQVIHNRTSQGMEYASNQALEIASGEFVAIHDDDDTWDPTFLSVTVAHLGTHSTSAAVAVRTHIVYEHEDAGRLIEDGRTPAWPEIHAISIADLLRSNQAVPISCLYRASVLRELGGFDAGLPVVGDWQMHLRLALNHPFDFLDGRPLAFWHQRPQASGAAANSVFGAAASHWRFDAEVRNQIAREHLQPGQEALGLLIANQIERSRRELSEQIDRLSTRLDQLDHSRRLEGLEHHAEQIRRHLDDVTVKQGQAAESASSLSQKADWLLRKADRSSLFAYARYAIRRAIKGY